MSKSVKTIDESLLATDAIEIMQRNEIYMLVVTKKNKKISGLIRMHDLLKAGLI
jgi:arabinose-5-phosphate isomerase